MQGSIFITGGAGFLGRAIIATAEREAWPARFTIYSRDETKQDELKRRFPGSLITCVLGDVCDERHLEAAMLGHNAVIHAAAVKYIPEAERNSWECVRINVDGSRAVARAAGRAGIPVCIGISTDKAVEPVNQYGRTKALMEHLFAEAGRWWPSTQYATIRYGNVIGSTGSVIPFWQRQIRDRKLTVTDPRMTRFWLSPERAVGLINDTAEDLLAAQVPNGSVMIGLCPSMTIASLAGAVLLTSEEGLTFDHDMATDGVEWVERIITGMRPGEKLDECLLGSAEVPRAGRWRAGFYIPPVDTPLRVDGPTFTTGRYVSSDPSSVMSPTDMARAIVEAARL